MAACGFKNNLPLSKKFFILYQLCEEQLSKQVHYDFGLRNILAVLRTLGTQRRSNLNDSEETILMRVLKAMNVSKLVDQDEKIFLSLIEDLFVGLKSTTMSYRELQAAIGVACSEMAYVNHPSWNLKIIQVIVRSVREFRRGATHVRDCIADLRNVPGTSRADDIGPDRIRQDGRHPLLAVGSDQNGTYALRVPNESESHYGATDVRQTGRGHQRLDRRHIFDALETDVKSTLNTHVYDIH